MSLNLTPYDEERVFQLKRIDDQLIIVLTAYADGEKALLVGIVPAEQTTSFPRRLDAEKDLSIFYYAQKRSVQHEISVARVSEVHELITRAAAPPNHPRGVWLLFSLH